MGLSWNIQSSDVKRPSCKVQYDFRLDEQDWEKVCWGRVPKAVARSAAHQLSRRAKWAAVLRRAASPEGGGWELDFKPEDMTPGRLQALARVIDLEFFQGSFHREVKKQLGRQVSYCSGDIQELYGNAIPRGDAVMAAAAAATPAAAAGARFHPLPMVLPSRRFRTVTSYTLRRPLSTGDATGQAYDAATATCGIPEAVEAGWGRPVAPRGLVRLSMPTSSPISSRLGCCTTGAATNSSATDAANIPAAGGCNVSVIGISSGNGSCNGNGSGNGMSAPPRSSLGSLWAASTPMVCTAATATVIGTTEMSPGPFGSGNTTSHCARNGSSGVSSGGSSNSSGGESGGVPGSDRGPLQGLRKWWRQRRRDRSGNRDGGGGGRDGKSGGGDGHAAGMALLATEGAAPSATYTHSLGRVTFWRQVWGAHSPSVGNPMRLDGVVCSSRLCWLAHTLGHEMLHAMLFNMCGQFARYAPHNMSFEGHGYNFLVLNWYILGHRGYTYNPRGWRPPPPVPCRL